MTGNRTAALGLIVAVAGALLLGVFVLSGRTAAPTQSEATVAVLRATAAVAPGTGADALGGQVERVDMPVSLAPENPIGDLGDVAGKEVVRPVGAGEVLVGHQFAAAGPLAGGLVVPAGHEAVSVEADPAPGVEGYVTPGSRVNVYLTISELAEDPEDPDAGPREQQFTQLVLGHLDVLAVTRGDLTGQARPPEDERPEGRVVLLLQVRPQDAPVLIDAEQRGKLWFSLVNPDDPAPHAVRVDAGAYEADARTHSISEAYHLRESTVQPAAQR